MSSGTHFNFAGAKNFLVAGGGHGIGLGLVKHLVTAYKDLVVHATFRQAEKAEELFLMRETYSQRLHLHELAASKEQDYEELSRSITAHSPRLDGFINCIGYLHDDQNGPEKKLADVNPEQVLHVFQINSLPTLLFAKHLLHLFKHQDPTIFAAISARVGSIGDNRSGGWYSYRASKAAMNMFIKNIALEYQKYRCNTLVLALHPGTTETELSLPFIGRSKYTIHSPEEAASNLIKVLSDRTSEDHGGFFDWEGKRVPW